MTTIDWKHLQKNGHIIVELKSTKESQHITFNKGPTI
jgi:hypothetical protein